MRSVFISFTFLISFSFYSNAQTKPTVVSGYVFDDINNNGVRDANEKGIKNVSVCDQVNVVTTNEIGFYQIQYTSTYGFLFVSLPDGFSSKAWW